MRLWFKRVYVDDIVAGRKTFTIRKADGQVPAVGERVTFSVGPRHPFAHVRIVDVQPVRLADIDDKTARADGHPSAAELRRAVVELYGRRVRLVRIDFVLVDAPDPDLTLFDTPPGRRPR